MSARRSETVLEDVGQRAVPGRGLCARRSEEAPELRGSDHPAALAAARGKDGRADALHFCLIAHRDS